MYRHKYMKEKLQIRKLKPVIKRRVTTTVNFELVVP